MKNKIITTIITMMALIILSFTSSSQEYHFQSDQNRGTTYGSSTNTDLPIARDGSLLNIRRDKDTAVFPPLYGLYSGKFDTDIINPYIEKQYEEKPFSAWISDYSGNSCEPSAEGLMLSSSVSEQYHISYFSVSISETLQTEPTYLSDGSIGTLKVQGYNKTIKIFEDTTVENMRKGLGHATYTSAWDGNVGLFGHNRGNYAYFSFLKDLKKGDKITYSTNYGTRYYKVNGIHKINMDDTSCLGWSGENMLTMITCIADQPQFRLCVTATEIS